MSRDKLYTRDMLWHTISRTEPFSERNEMLRSLGKKGAVDRCGCLYAVQRRRLFAYSFFSQVTASTYSPCFHDPGCSWHHNHYTRHPLSALEVDLRAPSLSVPALSFHSFLYSLKAF